MAGSTIGIRMNHGYAGAYARHPEMMVATRPNNSEEYITFGAPLMRDGEGGVLPVSASFTATTFEGVATSAIKTAWNYATQNQGGTYAPKEPVAVFQRGSINVLNPTGDATFNAPVYVRITADGAKQVGDFEATADGANSILLDNAQWGGTPDTNNVAELVLLTRNNA